MLLEILAGMISDRNSDAFQCLSLPWDGEIERTRAAETELGGVMGNWSRNLAGEMREMGGWMITSVSIYPPAASPLLNAAAQVFVSIESGWVFFFLCKISKYFLWGSCAEKCVPSSRNWKVISILSFLTEAVHLSLHNRSCKFAQIA